MVLDKKVPLAFQGNQFSQYVQSEIFLPYKWFVLVVTILSQKSYNIFESKTKSA